MKLVIDNVSKNFIDPQGKQLSVLENVSLTVHSRGICSFGRAFRLR